MTPTFLVIPFVSAARSAADEAATLNADYAHYLLTAPVHPREPLLWRLLPKDMRASLKARSEARRHEDELIALWNTSPHLLLDIGMVPSEDAVLTEDLVRAPKRVIAHVEAVTAAEKAAAKGPIPAEVMPPVARKRTSRKASPSFEALPAHGFA